MDRIMIDPAYKLEQLKLAHEKAYTMRLALDLVSRQVSDLAYVVKLPFGRDLYESWYQIEKSLMQFDRIWNKVEKFDARSFTDSFNHERREKRMLQRKNERWVKNYTYFFGNLTEEEQMYRDYFETELELNPEDDYMDQLGDEEYIASFGVLNP
mmetsp:Transcript_5611/g.9664  ORF Transcript_5611/g.9664 Transcript_5611/m.9664 type:complete len:154 (+) Transcript_5611:697-1158(+)